MRATNVVLVHVSMLSHPDVVANLIVRVAELVE